MALDKQHELQLVINDCAGVNVVTCGECGQVFYHEIKEGNLVCPHCGYESEQCDFPDLFYEGWGWKE